MTYISRKTRITGSRFLDENDADFTLRVARKRSDGRLKRHSSCDDLRAWVNNNCIKHEYLVDLMSDGEAVTNIRLYGRFIPVPVLVDVLKNGELNRRSASTLGVKDNISSVENVGPTLQDVYLPKDESSNSDYEQDEEELACLESIRVHIVNEKLKICQTADGKSNLSTDSEDDKSNIFSTGKGLSDDDEDDSEKSEDNEFIETLQAVQREKNLLEEMLLACMDLLRKATRKLDKVNVVVHLAQGDMECFKNEDIQDALVNSSFSCSVNSDNPENTDIFSSSKSYIKKLKNSVRCRELLRKISGLRDKLKKIQDCRQDINQQILMSQQRMGNYSTSPLQITELYNRKEQALVKRLQNNMEKLIAEKGKLLSEMCQALNSLKSLKKSSKSSTNFSKKGSKAFQDVKCEEMNCNCGYQLSDHFDTSDSDKMIHPRSSAESYLRDGCDKARRADSVVTYFVPNSYSKKNSGTRNQFEPTRPYVSVEFSSSVHDRERIHSVRPTISVECSISQNDSTRTVSIRENENPRSSGYKNEKMKRFENERFNSASAPGFRNSKNPQVKIRCVTDEKERQRKDSAKMVQKSKLRFVCPEPYKGNSQYGSLLNFQVSISAEDKSVKRPCLTNTRPSTSPTTKEEKFRKSYRPSSLSTKHFSSNNFMGNVPQRRIKSETTMQEVEKALRNYEERLKHFDCLENKVEDLRQRLAEARYCGRVLAKQKAELKKARAVETERSAQEITRLCSENWDLKRQVQQMARKFDVQCKRIQTLKTGTRRARELEVETEVLRKEVSGYRGNFEEQQKCIARLHSVVAVQRTEIENLMDHIRKLTMVRVPPYSAPNPERRSVQKSRSYSPDSGKLKRILRAKCQGAVRGSMKSSDEEPPNYCYCDLRGRRSKAQQRSVEVNVYPSNVQSNEWS